MNLTKLLFAPLILLITCILVVCVSTYNYSNLIKNMYVEEENTNSMLFQSNKVFSLTQDMVLSSRGYLITGDSVYLRPFMDASKLIDKNIDSLTNVKVKTPKELSLISLLQQLIKERIEISRKNIETRNEKGFDVAKQQVNEGYGKRVMDKIRIIVGCIQKFENENREEYRKENKSIMAIYNQKYYRLIILTLILILLLFCFTFMYMHQKNKAEKALKPYDACIKSLINLSPIGFAIATRQGKLLEISQSIVDMAGYSSKEELISFSTLDFYENRSDREKVLELLDKDRKAQDFEFSAKKKNGEQLWLSIYFRSLKWTNNEMVIMASVSDITQRKEMEEKLIADKQALEAYSYSVSHDLQTPIRSLNFYAELLKVDYGRKLDSEANQLIDNITITGKKMKDLTTDLLTFANSGSRELTKRNVDMNEMVTGIITEQKALLNNEHTQFLVGQLPIVRCDGTLILQVWINLISNAIKYSTNKENAKIEIDYETRTNESVFYIRDNGAGFDMQYAEKLFRVFQRLHSSRKFEGNGLGLAIVKQIVSRHGGKVWVDAKEGEGATFYFSIPT